MKASFSWMDQALALAAKSQHITSPNPRVGCVITRADGQILGMGHTQQAGGPHAEIMALQDACAKGHSLAGATVHVTLEPCCHTGRTGPCCDALIAAGVAKVVASLADPNPRVAGQGFARLRAAGIEVLTGPGASASRELNLGFFSRMLRQRPWVRLKIAASLDGQTALTNGRSQWITAEAARADGHAWRAKSCAVLTGIGTVLADNPRLDVRWPDAVRQPAVVVLDSRLQTPPDARLLEACRARYLYTAVQGSPLAPALHQQGATVIDMPDAKGQVDLLFMLHDLAKREINWLHVEAGARLNGALMGAGLVDELLVYLAPKMLGAGRGMAQWGPLHDLTQALPLTFVSTETVGTDLRVVARVCGSDAF